MHTDRKIGFALGILLIGIVASLFFRNEPLLENGVPAVRRERELNERLRERDVAVYLNESNDDQGETPPAGSDHPWTLRDVLDHMSRRGKSTPSPVRPATVVFRRTSDGRIPPSLDGYRRSANSSADTSSVVQVPDDSPEEEPLPNPVAPPPNPLPPLFPPEIHKTPEIPKAAASEPISEESPEFQAPDEFDEYVVKYGDTLSGIAFKYLGSQARYREIYEANRDRMQSPDRLDVGKPIRIPRVAGETAQAF